MQSDNSFETMLAAPLDHVADDGFSRQVLARVARHETQRSRIALLQTIAVAVLAAIVAVLVGLVPALAHLGAVAARSAPLYLALAAIVLTLSLDRALREA